MKNIILYARALADPVRARILTLLRERELPVHEVTAVLAMGQSRVSRHLRILTDAGLLRFRREGLRVHYSAVREGDGAEFLTALESFLPSSASDVRRLAVIRRRSAREAVRFFDSASSDWETMKKEILGPADLVRPVRALMKSCRAAADLGCGPGDFLPALKAHARRVIGVDSSSGMLRLARARFGRRPGFDLRMGELEHLPLQDAETDFCLCSFVLHHLADPDLGLREVARVLKPGGRLCVIELRAHSDERMRLRFGDRRLGFYPEELMRLLATAGFTGRRSASRNLKKGFVADIYLFIRKK